MDYLIKIVLCSGLLYLIHIVFFQKEKMYYFNRYYLLFSILFSFCIPFIQIPQQSQLIAFEELFYVHNQFLTSSPENPTDVFIDRKQLGWTRDPFFIGYIFITTLLLIRFIWNLRLLLKTINNSTVVKYENKRLVLVDHQILPFSFLHYTFLNKKDYCKGRIENEIIHHEGTHVGQYHTLDILFIELMIVFCWFNPFLFAFKRAIQLNHEFLADAAVIDKYGDPKAYQNLILIKTSRDSYSTIGSSFYLSTKKRLIMMMKTTSKTAIILKQSSVLPLFLALIFLFCTKLAAQDSTRNKSINSTSQKKNDTTIAHVISGVSIGYTDAGVSQELLTEYQLILDKYRTAKGFLGIAGDDKNRLQYIFRQMNKDQQSKQEVQFFKLPKPLPRITPSQDQFKNFKKGTVYGVWIDGKKVSGAALNNYANTDFSQYYISKLYGAAKIGRSYSHQVDLMTHDYYNRYYQERINKDNSIIIYRKMNY